MIIFFSLKIITTKYTFPDNILKINSNVFKYLENKSLVPV